MKKKTFFQNSWYFCLMFSIEILFAIACVGLLVSVIFFNLSTNLSLPKWFQITMFSLGVCLMIYLIVIWARDRIVLEPNRIYVPDSWNKTVVKVQYKTEVNYADIEGVFIAETQKDSLNLNDCSAIPMPYIVIDCKNGDQKLINMYWYSKKRLKTILDEIIARARNVGNDFTSETGEEIYNTFIIKRKEEYRELKEKRDFLQERKMTRTISSIISPYGYKIDYFRYYPNVFGNIVLKIKKGDIIETFITDRGEIYYNDKMVAKSENTLNLQKQLLRVISDIVSKED